MKVDHDDDESEDDDDEDEEDGSDEEVPKLSTILCLRMYFLWWSPIASCFCLDVGSVQVSSVRSSPIWSCTF